MAVERSPHFRNDLTGTYRRIQPDYPHAGFRFGWGWTGGHANPAPAWGGSLHSSRAGVLSTPRRRR
jgi:hypothetical protein